MLTERERILCEICCQIRTPESIRIPKCELYSCILVGFKYEKAGKEMKCETG